MNEFEEKDYAGARSYADNIKNNAENIMGIFNDIDGVMNSLYGSNWGSTGADNARDRYNEIRKKCLIKKKLYASFSFSLISCFNSFLLLCLIIFLYIGTSLVNIKYIK